MDQNNKFQISYNPLRCRVKISFMSGECMSPSFNVEEILKKATDRIKKEKEQGSIRDYIVFVNGFKRFIQAVRDDIRKGGNQYLKLDFVLAGGAIHIPEFSLETSQVEDVSFYLNLKNSPILQKINYDLFKISLLCSLKNTPITRPNMAQVQSAFLRVTQTNEECTHFPIGTLPILEDRKSLYKVYTNKKRKEVILMINRKEAFIPHNSVEMFKTVYNSVIYFSKQINKKIFLYKKELIDEFDILSSGRRRYGIDLPVTILVGSDRPSSKTEEYESNPKPKVKEMYQIKEEDWGPVRLKISDKAMEASITRFDMSLYDKMELSKDWFIQELARLKITNGIQDEYLDKIAEAIEKKENLDGFVVASGQVGEAASEPYLVPLKGINPEESAKKSEDENNEEDSKASSAPLQDKDGIFNDNLPIDRGPVVEDTSSNIDLRKTQQKQIVHENDQVAKITYKYPASPSINIFSEKITTKSPLVPEGITIGDNFKVINDGIVVALKSGLISFDENFKSISLSEVYVHKGDINLQTGDVIFDGDVEIEGSVDEGSTIIANGNITIQGNVTKATIKAKGSLTVTYGIVTGDNAYVYSGGDITADFIQFSNIYCKGSLNVNKSIMTSKVYVGKNITLDETSGIIAGGEIICGQNIVTNKIGTEGSGSRIKVGVDWKILETINIRSERLKKYIRLFKEQEAIYKDLSTRYANQKTQNHIQLEQKLKKQIPRYNDLLAKMKAHLDKAKQKLLFNYGASIKITGDLLANNIFEVCDIQIPVTYDLNAVTIDSRKYKGSYIHKMNEPKDEAGEAPSKKESSTKQQEKPADSMQEAPKDSNPKASTDSSADQENAPTSTEVPAQESTTDEQQTQASEQQTQASEQQAQAGEQQTQASEQQAQAGEQQNQASEQQTQAPSNTEESTSTEQANSADADKKSA